jgi:hypothetical protein
MDLNKILAELKEEKLRVEEAIMALQRVGLATGGKRRGRPPKWMMDAKQKEDAPKKRGRPPKAS